MDPIIREAGLEDVPRIVEMLADDELGARRERFEDPIPRSYVETFAAIDRDPNHELVVAEEDGRVIGVLQLTFLPYLTYQGGWRALVEGVRVDREARSQGLGKVLLTWAIDRARQRGCHVIQLTTDRRRPQAQRFYESLGFIPSHLGMKLHLDVPETP